MLDDPAGGGRFGLSSAAEKEECCSSPLRPLLPLLPLGDSPDGDSSSDEVRDAVLRTGGEGGAAAGEKGATRTDRIAVVAPPPPDAAVASSSAGPPGSPAGTHADGRFCDDMANWWRG